MKKTFQPIDLTNLTTYSIEGRKSTVSAGDFASPWKQGGSFETFLASLPSILAGNDIIDVIDALARAAGDKRTIMLGMGAHVIKVGLAPLIIDLMERGVISSIAMNGAGIIHDLEIAMTGRTSEDVAASIGDGAFGMARETCAFLGDAVKRAGKEDSGLGIAVGRSIIDGQLPMADKSILAAGARLSIPVTVHVAMGTDIIHMHPGFDPAACGNATHKDFRTFASVVSSLEQGVYMNVGSAVILPEVFLKAITLVRNLGFTPENFTTVNMDFIRHYRPMTNVVNRPTLGSGRGFNLVGHHEIMFPLIAAGLLEKLGVSS